MSPSEWIDPFHSELEGVDHSASFPLVKFLDDSEEEPGQRVGHRRIRRERFLKHCFPGLPVIENFVSTVRDQAVFVLAQCPGMREFLDQRALVEQSASVLRFLLTGRTKEERDARFNARLADLLKRADEAVRLEALSFVAGDLFKSQAPRPNLMRKF